MSSPSSCRRLRATWVLPLPKSSGWSAPMFSVSPHCCSLRVPSPIVSAGGRCFSAGSACLRSLHCCAEPRRARRHFIWLAAPKEQGPRFCSRLRSRSLAMLSTTRPSGHGPGRSGAESWASQWCLRRSSVASSPTDSAGAGPSMSTCRSARCWAAPSFGSSRSRATARRAASTPRASSSSRLRCSA